MNFQVHLGIAVFVLVTMLFLGARRPLELLIWPLGVSLGTYALFRYGFGTMLPVWV